MDTAGLILQDDCDCTALMRAISEDRDSKIIEVLVNKMSAAEILDIRDADDHNALTAKINSELGLNKSTLDMNTKEELKKEQPKTNIKSYDNAAQMPDFK